MSNTPKFLPLSVVVPRIRRFVEQKSACFSVNAAQEVWLESYTVSQFLAVTDAVQGWLTALNLVQTGMRVYFSKVTATDEMQLLYVPTVEGTCHVSPTTSPNMCIDNDFLTLPAAVGSWPAGTPCIFAPAQLKSGDPFSTALVTVQVASAHVTAFQEEVLPCLNETISYEHAGDTRSVYFSNPDWTFFLDMLRTGNYDDVRVYATAYEENYVQVSGTQTLNLADRLSIHFVPVHQTKLELLEQSLERKNEEQTVLWEQTLLLLEEEEEDDDNYNTGNPCPPGNATTDCRGNGLP
jgi:hypothetical protein